MSSAGSAFARRANLEQKEGQCPPPTNGISKITLKVVVFHFSPAETAPTYPTPLKSFHKVGTRVKLNRVFFPADSAKPVPLAVVLLDSRRGAAPKGRSQIRPRPDAATTSLAQRGASSSPPTARRVGDWDPVPSPRANPFPSSGSILPTSLAYIVPSTRGCSPWRPDAVMSTTRRGRHFRSSGFQGQPGLPDTTRGVAICTGGAPPRLRAEVFLAAARVSLLIEAWLLPGGGVWVSARLGTVTRLFGSSRAASSAYQNGPLGALDSVARLNEAAAQSYLFKNFAAPGSSYPEGNFGGNQLLDGSISLRPYTQVRRAICRVGIAAGLHQSFLGRPSGIVHHLWSRQVCSHSNPSPEDLGGSAVQPARDPANQLPCALRVWCSPLTSHTCRRLLGPCFKAGRMGSPLAGAKKRAPVPPARASGGRSPPSSVREAAYPRAGSSARAWVARDQRRLGPNLPPYLGCIPKQPDFADSASRSRRGPGTTGLSPSLAPFHGTCARSVAKGGFCGTTIRAAKAARFSSWALPVKLAVTRGILQGLPVRGRQLPAGVLLSQGLLGPRLEPRRGQGEAEPPLSSCRSALGAKCFQPTSPGGQGRPICCAPATRPHRQRWGSRATGVGELRRAWRPGRCTLDLVASGATCVQRLRWFAGFCNSHQVSHFASFFIDREPRYPLPRVVLGYRVRGRDAKATPVGPRASSLNSTDRARWLFVCSRPGPSRAAGAEPVGAGREQRRGDSTGVYAPGQRPSPSGASCAASLSLVQWTSRALSAANRQRRPAIRTLHRTIQSLTELTRQIAPPTKNGHAPPPIESRKSSRSVNPYYVWTCTGGTTRQLRPGRASPGRRGESTCAHREDGPIDQPKPFLRLPLESNPNSPSPVNTMDQPGSILSRDRGASTTAPDRESPQHPGQGHRRSSKKLGDQTSFANPTKSIGTAAFTWVHEHFRRPAFEHTRRETKPEGK
ncbi:hypothetical protein H6P81_021243 [Aristolochia fimbriata]|uniref:Uncharacterized protein n=1 Tax=Aristolochia fimbriata TaxID=158543 RepID=A0AAV7DRI3_ARIFI|nr:hypothetical protein H6P81_021243 [Aristolochia fimbriata]